MDEPTDKKGFLNIYGVALLLIIAVAVTYGLRNDLKPRASGKIWNERSNMRPLVELDTAQRPMSFVPLVNESNNAVVNINTFSLAKDNEDHGGLNEQREKGIPYGDLYDNFSGNNDSKYFRRVNLGSGFIINRKGYILTNYHVIQSSTKVNVTMSDSKEFEARIVGRDPGRDVALLKISAEHDLPFVPLGNSDKMQVGEWVVAIGNPFGLGNTVTAGIISAKGRLLGLGTTNTFIQTDAPINQGNSGGPLLNINGEVVGINTAIIARGTGIGFAIPINSIKQTLSEMASENQTDKSWIGVRIQPVDRLIAKSFGMKGRSGVLVGDVAAGTPAEKAEIKTGDIILSYDGNSISSCMELNSFIEKSEPGVPMKIILFRDEEIRMVDITPVELSRNFLVRSSGAIADRIGIVVSDISQSKIIQEGFPEAGVIVESVEEGGIGYEARILEGDVILEFNNVSVKNSSDFKKILQESSANSNFLFLILRQKKTLFMSAGID